MREYLKELKKQLESFLGFDLTGWTLEEALKSAENSGAVIFWATIERKIGDLNIKL